MLYSGSLLIILIWVFVWCPNNLITIGQSPACSHIGPRKRLQQKGFLVGESGSVSCSVMSNSLRSQGAHQAPLSMDFSRQEYWSALPFPSPKDPSDLGIKPGTPALQADSLLSEPPGKPLFQ